MNSPQPPIPTIPSTVRRTLIAIGLVALMIGSIVAPAATLTASPPGTLAAGATTATVEGQLNVSDGTAAAEDTLRFKGVDGTEDFVALQTNATGHFSADLVAGGDYDVEYLQDNTSTHDDIAFPRDRSPDVYALAQINATDGDRIATTLPTAYGLNVSVVNESGDPVPSATVHVHHTNGDAGAGVSVPVNANGLLEEPTSDGPGLEVVGHINLDVDPGTGRYASSHAEVGVSEPTNVTLVLHPAANVSGTLEQADGSPAANDTVIWRGRDATNHYFENVTTRSGAFAARLQSGGTYDIAYHQDDRHNESDLAYPKDGSADLVAIGRRSISSDLDVGTNRLPVGHNLTVTVVDEGGTPVSGAVVHVTHRVDPPTAEEEVRASVRAETNATGDLVHPESDGPGFEVNGSIDVHVDPPSGVDLAARGVEVTVTGDYHLTVTLPQAVNVTGSIDYADATPAAGWRVQVNGIDGTRSGAQNRTDAAGGFRTTVAANGTYELGFTQRNASRTGSFPKDKRPDLQVLDRLSTDAADVDVGLQSLRRPHLVNISVETDNGTPVTAGEVTIGQVDLDREIGVYETASLTGAGQVIMEGASVPGVEINGTLFVEVRPADSVLATTREEFDISARSNVTVVVGTTVEFSGNLSEVDGTPAAGDRLSFDGREGTHDDTRVLTDSTGHFSIDLLDGGTYDASYYQNDFIDDGDVPYPKDGTVDIDALGRATFTRDHNVDPWRMAVGHNLTVLVVDQNGNAIEGATVHVSPHEDIPGTHDAAHAHETAVTNGSGHLWYPGSDGPGFEVNGTVHVDVDPPSEAYVGEFTTVDVTDDTRLTMVIRPAVNVSGTLSEVDGTPAGDDHLQWHDRTVQFGADNVTRPDGAYGVRLAENSSYELLYHQDDPTNDSDVAFPTDGTVDIEAIGVVSVGGADVVRNRTLPRGHNLTVTVTNATGSPIPNATVHVASHADIPGSDDAVHAHVAAKTNASGELIHPQSDGPGFEVNGTVHVDVEAPASGNYTDNGTMIDVSSDRHLTFVLQETVSASGQIVDSDGSPAAADRVFFWGIEEAGTNHGTDVPTDADGNFSAALLPNASYRNGYEQRDPTDDTATVWPTDGVPDIHAIGRVDTGTDPLELGTHQLPAAHRLNVTVVNETGHPIEDARVHVISIDGDVHVGTQARTTVDGELRHPNGDDVGIEVVGEVDVHVEPPDGSTYSDNGTRLTVTGDRELTIVLPSTVPVSGWATDSTGSPVPDAQIVFDGDGEAGTHHWTDNVTTAGGNFSAGVVEGGTYNVEFRQDDPRSTTDVAYPRDGVPDIFLIDHRTFDAATAIGEVGLPAAHAVNVTVVNETGQPIEGARIDVGHRAHGSQSGIHDFTTDAQGRLIHPEGAVPGVEVVGEVEIHVTPPEGSPYVQNDTHLANVTGDRNLTIVLTEALRASGRVLRPGGAPAADNVVQFAGVHDAGTDHYVDNVTQTTGNFSAALRHNGTYDVAFLERTASDAVPEFPTNGVPDVYAITRLESVTADVDLGNVSLPGAHRLNVTVVNATGHPIENARVNVGHRSGDASGWINAPTTAAGLMVQPEADDPGFEVVGEIDIHVEPPPNGPYRDNGTRITVTGDRHVTIVLEKVAAVTGTLRRHDGSPGATDNVFALAPGVDPPDNLLAANVTTAAGDFRLAVPARQRYHLGALQYNETANHLGDRDGTADLLAVHNRSDASAVDLGNVTLPPGHVVNLSVTDPAGQPVADAVVDVVHVNDTTGARAVFFDNPTNADGKLVAKALPFADVNRSDVPGLELNGTVVFEVRPPDDPRFVDRTYTLTETISSDRELSITLEERPRIVGRFLEADGSDAVDDSVVIFGEGPSPGSFEFARTNATGHFATFADANATFDVQYYQANFSSANTDVNFPRDGSVDVYAAARANTSGGTDDIGEIRVPAGFVLNVSVVDPAGSPVANAYVEAGHRNLTSGVTAGLGVLTNPDGLLELNGPGNYSEAPPPGVELVGNVTLTVKPPAGATRFVDRTYERTVTVDRNMTVNFTLIDTVNVTGTLSEHSGAPAVGDAVRARENGTLADPSTFSLTDHNLTTAAGDFALRVPNGTDHHLTYVQLDENASTHTVGERDGSVDLWPLDRRTLSGDLALGDLTLPAGHLVNVSVIDNHSLPVEDARIALLVRNQPANASIATPWVTTPPDGLFYPDGHATPGIELNGNVTVYVRPPANTSNENKTFTQTLTVSAPRNVTIQLNASYTDDATPPSISSAQAVDATDNDGTVRDGDRIDLSVTVSDAATGVDTVIANASAFGAGEVVLTDGDDDGVFTGSIIVDADAAAPTGSAYTIEIVANDSAGNVARADTNQLTLEQVKKTKTSLPGFGPVVAVLGIMLAILIGRRRR